jgi:CRISPR/Cas system endoribonuclease Cas6 (RAMP superfamily)
MHNAFLSIRILHGDLQRITVHFRHKHLSATDFFTVIRLKFLSGFHKQLANALLAFGTYSGVGIKTTLGMGGLEITTR